MFTKSLLINYAGYPESPRMLVPDNGLANLAGVLISKGHKTIILDYATVDIVEKLFPYEYKDRIENVIKRILVNLKQKLSPKQKDLDIFHKLDNEIDQLQRKKVKEIAIEISSIVKKHNIDFVGMKLWMGDGFEGSITIAKQLKKDFPTLPIFAGGPHVDWFREKILDVCNLFDVLVYGEGEEVINMLADYVLGKTNLENIPNLIYKENGKIVTTPRKVIDDLNKLPLPVYDKEVYLSMGDTQKLKIIFTDESRGCPNNCSFCLHPVKSGNKWKTKSPESAVNEMERLINKYGINVFRFAGSNTPKLLAKGIAEEILKRKLKVEYTAFANSGNGVSVEDFQLMKDSGCFSLWFGIESGNQKLLDEVMNKKMKVEQLKNKINACKKTGIYVTGSIIIPAPNETEQTKQDTLNFLLETRPDSVIVDPPVLIPGTKWTINCEKYGIEILDEKEFLNQMMLYKMKIIYPPILWKALPYFKINNKTDKELVRETGLFAQTLEKNGILTQVTSDTALIAKYAGMQPMEFRDKSRKYFSTGNHREIKKIITRINENITNSATN